MNHGSLLPESTALGLLLRRVYPLAGPRQTAPKHALIVFIV